VADVLEVHKPNETVDVMTRTRPTLGQEFWPVRGKRARRKIWRDTELILTLLNHSSTAMRNDHVSFRKLRRPYRYHKPARAKGYESACHSVIITFLTVIFVILRRRDCEWMMRQICSSVPRVTMMISSATFTISVLLSLFFSILDFKMVPIQSYSQL
jgi:hypothetical protein